MESGAVFEESKSRPSCDICQHKKELTSATHVCKQCRFFLCHSCCSTHVSLDHAIMELGRVIEARDLADVPKKNKTQTAAVKADDNIVDSDYESQGGLSTFFNAPENARLTKVSKFEVPSVQNMFCLTDGRICFHKDDEIIIYSKDYHRQFAIESSSLFGVIHTGGNTIAILDFELNIERLNITETDAKLKDNVRLVIPPGICVGKPSVKKLSRICKRYDYDYPAFLFGDGQYSLIFDEMVSEKVPVWCTFSLDGKPLRMIFLSAGLEARFVCQNHQKLYAGAHGSMRTFNQCGGHKYDGLPKRTNTYERKSTFECMYTDGYYVIYKEVITITKSLDLGWKNEKIYERKINLILVERGTKKERVFQDIQFSSIIIQNSLDRIISCDRGKYTVFGLS